MAKVIHLRLREPFNGRSDFIFGSLSAIYSVLTPDQVGVKLRYLFDNKIAKLERYENDKCVIERVELIRAKNNKSK